MEIPDDDVELGSHINADVVSHIQLLLNLSVTPHPAHRSVNNCSVNQSYEAIPKLDSILQAMRRKGRIDRMVNHLIIAANLRRGSSCAPGCRQRNKKSSEGGSRNTFMASTVGINGYRKGKCRSSKWYHRQTAG
eukprot:scaffold4810_cov98-Skeletonema_menzelii.AAC.2